MYTLRYTTTVYGTARVLNMPGKSKDMHNNNITAGTFQFHE